MSISTPSITQQNITFIQQWDDKRSSDIRLTIPEIKPGSHTPVGSVPEIKLGPLPPIRGSFPELDTIMKRGGRVAVPLEEQEEHTKYSASRSNSSMSDGKRRRIDGEGTVILTYNNRDIDVEKLR